MMIDRDGSAFLFEQMYYEVINTKDGTFILIATNNNLCGTIQLGEYDHYDYADDILEDMLLEYERGTKVYSL